MNNIIFIIISNVIVFLFYIIVFLYLFIIFIKIKNTIIYKKINNLRKETSILVNEIIFYMEKQKYNYMFCEEYNKVLKELERIKEKRFGTYVIEEGFKNFLEHKLNDKGSKIINIAIKIGLLKNLKRKFKSNKMNKVANVCRLAGLYRQKQYIPDILNTLKYFSGDIQLQALTALSRIGDIDAFVQAFLKISNFVIINPHMICEVINIFENDKIELYKRIFETKEPYICKLFIDCMNENQVGILIDDLEQFLEYEESYVKVAAINAMTIYKEKDNSVFISRFLDDENWNVKWSAGKALGLIEDID